jgi:hypothetical protein
LDVDSFIDLSESDSHLVVVPISLHDTCVLGYVRSGLKLEHVVVDHFEIVDKLNAQVATAHNVVLHVNKTVHFDVDCEAVSRELGRDLFIDFDKHVMAAFDDGLL